MKKVLVLVCVLAMVATASATVRIYFTKGLTTTGLADKAYDMQYTLGGSVWPDGMNGMDVYSGHWSVAGGTNAAFAPYNPAATVCTVNPGDTVYVWFQFYGEAASKQVSGIDFYTNFAVTDPRFHGRTMAAAWYLLDDTYAPDPNDENQAEYPAGDGTKRWNGDVSPERFAATDRVTLVAASGANGPKNQTGDDLAHLYKGGTSGSNNANRIALLGAMKFPAKGRTDIAYGTEEYDVQPILGGEKVAYLGTPSENWPTVTFGSIHVTPEPAALVLMGLAGLLIRRR